MGSSSKSEPRPHVACEITAGRVIAGRAGERASVLDTYTARTLPGGVLAPNLTATNVLDGIALRQTLSDALVTVGGRSRDISVLLPDSAVRVVLLDFDTLPDKRQDAEAVVRFRLKKALPFDVEKSAVSFQASRADGTVRVVAAVMLSSVLAEYEAAFRDLGYQPGVVIPATLAALRPVTADRPTLVIKVETNTTGVAIVENEELLLFRVLENDAGAQMNAELLAEEIYPSLVFFQDTYGTRVERVLIGGVVGVEAMGPALESQTGIRPQELVSASQVGGGSSTPRSMLAGVFGALIG